MDPIPDIAFRNVSFEFEVPGESRPLRVLDNVDLEILEGEIVVVVGPSGCGKTTLLKLGNEILKPTSGKVWINPSRRRLASVPQEPPLLPWRTMLQNAFLGLEIGKVGDFEEADVKRVENQVEKFGLRGFEDYFPDQLSGGMRQRVGLIRALVRTPHILFCDEPFSAIDFVGRLELTTRFREASKGRGVTTLFVTHNIEEAIFLGDRVIVMRGNPGRRDPGRIVQQFRRNLSVDKEDAVKCRNSPEFAPRFEEIWRALNG